MSSILEQHGGREGVRSLRQTLTLPVGVGKGVKETLDQIRSGLTTGMRICVTGIRGSKFRVEVTDYPREGLRKYLAGTGLGGLMEEAIDMKLNSIVPNTFALPRESIIPALTPRVIRSLYEYEVPKETRHGSCNLSGETATCNLARFYGLLKPGQPFDDNTVRELKNHPMTERLWRLRKVTQELMMLLGMNEENGWVGIYRNIQDPEAEHYAGEQDRKKGAPAGQQWRSWLKESYLGSPSRPTFPLTRAFAHGDGEKTFGSNNSMVGLTGMARVYPDVRQSPTYYPCDENVQAESCLPISLLDMDGNVVRDPTGSPVNVGGIDVESHVPRYLGPQIGPIKPGSEETLDSTTLDQRAAERTLQIAMVCRGLAMHDPYFRGHP